MSKEAWQEYIEELRGRTNSLKPPYPTFPEFLRGLMRLRTTAQIAKLVDAKKEAMVNAWSTGNTSVGTQLRKKVTDTLGYRFGERTFYEAAESVNWTGDAPGDLVAIRSLEALRMYLSELRDRVRIKELAKFFSFHTVSNLSDFIAGGQGLSGPSIVLILKKLPELSPHVTGEVLSLITPIATVMKVAEDCRLHLGIGRPEFAQMLGVTHGYYNYLVQRQDDPTGQKLGHTKDLERLTAMFAKLTELRAAQTSVRDHDDGDVRTDDEVPPVAPEKNFDGLVRELFEAHSEIHGIRQEQIRLLQRANEALARLEALRFKLAPDQPFPASSDATLEIELGARPVSAVPSPPPAAAEESYLSPFTQARWREHDLPIDSVLITMAKRQTEALCELLGLLAQMQDDGGRAKVQAELDGHTTELLITLDAFSQAHPGTKIATLYNSWRQFRNDLGVPDPKSGSGETRNGKRKEGT